MKPKDVKLPSKFLPTISLMEGDIGTDKRKQVKYESTRVRKYFHDEIEGPHEARFVKINSNLECISKYRRAPKVNIQQYSKRSGNLNPMKLNLDQSKVKKTRPPSNIGVFYDVSRCKAKTMMRVDKVPVFDKSLSLPRDLSLVQIS
jgi:hypothetical protein